ncbi:hypothetical protein CsSME_00049271 [Camellia sinensis var. sinensis]
MGRSLLSHFLILSNSPPRFTSSPISSRSCGIDVSRLLRTHIAIRHPRLPTGHSGVADSRCCCSLSASEPTAPEASSSSVKYFSVTVWAGLYWNFVYIAVKIWILTLRFSLILMIKNQSLILIM